MSFKHNLKIKVISFGGAGTKMINRIIETTYNKNIGYISISTSQEELVTSNATSKLLIGKKTTKGLGTFRNVETGEKSFKESEYNIREFLQKKLKDVNIVFLVGGLGGGTCTSVMPLVSKMIKDMGIVIISVVSIPFDFEETKAIEQANEGKEKLYDNVDLLLVSNSNNLSFEEVKSLMQTMKDIHDSIRYDVQEMANRLLSYELKDLSYDYLKDLVERIV